LRGSFEIDAPVELDSFHARATEALTPLGWVAQSEPHIRESDCTYHQEWWRQRGAWLWWTYDSIYLFLDCRRGLIDVRVNLRDRAKTLEQKLDEYYSLRNAVFPEILGVSAAELDYRTTEHPAQSVPVESLAAFDREPLDDAQKRRLALWEAGEWPSTREQGWESLRESLMEQRVWYGLPALIGTVVLLLVWRFVVRGRSYSVTAKRTLFVLLGTLAWAPAPMPMLPVTTVGAALFWPAPLFLIFLFPMWIVTGAIWVPGAAALVLWLISRILIRSGPTRSDGSTSG
jgi:hypothetical protein